MHMGHHRITMKACIKPGIQNKRVRIRLMKKLLPMPDFSPTASGGRKMARITRRSLFAGAAVDMVSYRLVVDWADPFSVIAESTVD